jgi:acetyl/propionyl-CoA carboxylase alpha subunit
MEILLKTEKLGADLRNAAISPIGGNIYEVKHNNQSYIIEVLSIDFAEKRMKIRHAHFTHELVFKDELDEVMDNMGIKRTSSTGEMSLKAPMPGKVIEVIAKAGDDIEPGSPLLILEAMKMENVLKSVVTAKIGKVHVAKGDNVEKSQLLVEFE